MYDRVHILHIGHEGKKSVSVYSDRRLNPQLHEYVMCLTNSLYLH